MARDILGLGGPDSNIKNLESTEPEVSSSDSDETARRRRRMSEGADELTPRPTDIDTGDRGKGTDLE
jgi:hypothetical protein